MPREVRYILKTFDFTREPTEDERKRVCNILDYSYKSEFDSWRLQDSACSNYMIALFTIIISMVLIRIFTYQSLLLLIILLAIVGTKFYNDNKDMKKILEHFHLYPYPFDTVACGG